ncbi:MAG: hypothetical protein PVI53_10125 [Desulfobacteraceae bacterium]|jgi:hypothetical protein
MNVGPGRGKNAGKVHPFVESVCPLMMCERIQTFKIAMEMPFRAVRVGV